MNLTMKLTGDAVRRIDRAGKLARSSIMTALRKGAARVVREAKINVRQGLHKTQPGTGALSRSLTMQEVSGDLAMRVGTGMIYARIHEYGGVIRPVRARMLAVPITPEARKHGPRQFPRPLFVVKGPKRAVLAEQDGDQMQVHYVLMSSVTMPARPYLRPALAAVHPWILNDLRDVVGYIFDPGDAAK